MKVEKTPQGTYAISHGAHRLEFTRAQYEDIFYALPQDSGTLFRLVNDTVLQADALRMVFRAMVAECGGSEAAMAELQRLVQAVEP